MPRLLCALVAFAAGLVGVLTVAVLVAGRTRVAERAAAVAIGPA